MTRPIEQAGPNLHVGIGTPGTARRFASYILRPEAVRTPKPYPYLDAARAEYPVFSRNMPPLLRGGESLDEIQDIYSTYVQTLREWEHALARGRDPGTEYLYAVGTFPTREWPTPKQAQAMADDFLAADFARARVIGAGHYNTGNYHLNLLILARDINGKKLQLGQRYFRLDERWAEVYLQHMEPDEARRQQRLTIHLQKKAETRRFKLALREELKRARDRGRPISMDEAVQRVARTMGIPQRYADYRRIELHPYAREAAQLVQRYATIAELSRRIRQAPESAGALQWRREMMELGGLVTVQRELTTLFDVHDGDPNFAPQVRRLAGEQAFGVAHAAITHHRSLPDFQLAR